MKIAIIAHYNPNMFPMLHYLACTLGAKGHDIVFFSVFEPNETGMSSENITWIPVRGATGWRRHFPVLRSAYPAIINALIAFRPDVMITENEFLLPALIYDMFPGPASRRIVGYFCDYYTDRRGMGLLKRLASRLDAYVDVCHLRLEWRQKDWPSMKARPFVIRQSPLRRKDASLQEHQGNIRVVYTGSRHALAMNRDQLTRFFCCLCEHGVSIDWYLAGSSAMQSSEDLQAEASSVCPNPLFAVHAPVEKAKLMQTLRGYHAGLFWAPMTEAASSGSFMRHYLQSAASNKIGEYIAAGLLVAHTGNPGLSYLPDDVCIPFDPTSPERGAEQLAAELNDKTNVRRRRQAALQYHLSEMNFEAQSAPLIDYILSP